MFEIRPFEPEHILAITPREPDASIAAGLPDLMEIAKLQKSLGPAFTGFWNGRAVAAAGLNIVWPRVAEGWAYTSELVRRHPCFFHRSIKRELERLITAHNLHRVQVHIPRSHSVSQEWIMRLGFEFESELPKYGQDGETYFCFAKVL